MKWEMMNLFRLIAVGVVAACIMGPQSALALVNPTLQPWDLFERHNCVVSLKVDAIDDDRGIVELEVVEVFKGVFAPKKVRLTLANEGVQQPFHILMSEGKTVVAFVGGKRRENKKEVLFYAGGEGRWQVAEVENLEDLSAWRWTEDLGPQKMYGTFNGSELRLAEMMDDAAKGRYFFPSLKFDQFHADQVIAHLEKPVRGVALYDIDGDGRPDIYACCEAGNRAYLQSAEGRFADATAKLGLLGATSVSCSFADVNADGRADILVDGVIYLQGANGKFTKSGLLPDDASRGVKMSTFCDIDGDGYPDCLISRTQGGLRAYLNPGAKGDAFRDATAAIGLDREECGSLQNGFVMHGDWQGDGRTALFYAVGGGLLLVQDAGGKFSPVQDTIQSDLSTDGQAAGLTGAGCFAPTWRPDRSDVVFSKDTGVNILANSDGKPIDAAEYGNEIVVSSKGNLPVIAEDLNADGNVDIYVGSRTGETNTYYMNRGYGSFMAPLRNNEKAMPGAAHRKGAWGLAAGDANGDGANDLLLGGIDGTLTLILNDVLGQRKAKEHPTLQEQKLDQTKILSVSVAGRLGVFGATVTLADQTGRIVGRRDIGSNVATGCRGPDMVNLAVRLPGAHLLTVRYSDGLTRSLPVDLSKERHVSVKVNRDTAERKGP